MTPLFLAIERVHKLCVKHLIRRDTNILCYTSDKYGSALHIAAKCSNLSAVDAILKHIERKKIDFDLNFVDENGYTAIRYAINENRYN